MVKIVRDFVEKTRFLIWCDASCCIFAAGEVAPPTEEQNALGQAEQIEHKQMAGFVSALIQAGWKIELHRQLCPQHAKKEAGETSRILIPVGRLTPLNQ
jgi:hypothetical protein